MTMTHGIYTMQDLLAQKFPLKGQNLDAIAAAVQAETDYINARNNEMLAAFCESSADARRIWGTSVAKTFVEVSEHDRGSGQKDVPGTEIDFPLREFNHVTGWTQNFFDHKTVRDLALSVAGVQQAYQNRLRDELKFALYNKSNYSFIDRLGDGTTLAIKAFANADGDPIPNAPDGSTFAGATHQHYNGTSGASLAFGDIDTLIANVTEHGLTGVALVINQSNVATLTGLASTKFVALTIAELAVSGRTSGTVETMDVVNSDPSNRLVGYWAGYPVYTKPWAPANYYMAVSMNAPEKPLVHRLDSVAGNSGLRVLNAYGMHPLTAQTWLAELGFGAWNRVAAAFLKGDAQTTYTNPTLIRSVA